MGYSVAATLGTRPRMRAMPDASTGFERVRLANHIGALDGALLVTDRFARHGITVVDADLAARIVVEPGTPADLAKRSVAETAKWAKAIKDANIEPQ